MNYDSLFNNLYTRSCHVLRDSLNCFLPAYYTADKRASRAQMDTYDVANQENIFIILNSINSGTNVVFENFLSDLGVFSFKVVRELKRECNSMQKYYKLQVQSVNKFKIM